jgi:hypothetical protein
MTEGVPVDRCINSGRLMGQFSLPLMGHANNRLRHVAPLALRHAKSPYLVKDRFNKAVADALYASRYQVSPALDAIVSAGARQICTYNFDDLIEEALAIHGLPFQSLTPGDALNADFTGTTVFHPHGFLTASMTADECANTRIVLSEEDYHGLYANPY